ncbi:MAG: hypothetical protein JSS70_00175 [Bacteroidetes bacterium]|nr:hypothetical protein [Bacteroidota bacterium]
MKTKLIQLPENPKVEMNGGKTISFHRAKEIMKEEGIEYTDEELKEVLDFISKVISITTSHYERIKQKQPKVISINTNKPHETKSISLYSSEHRRTG